MDINLELYKVFYYVAKYKSMTKAAEKLMVSQPAVTKSIKTLEMELGGTLFLRSNKGLELTEEGKNFYDKIEPALALIKTAEDNFGEYKSLNVGEIKIGISSVLTKTLLLDILKNFRNAYPNIKISITNGLTSDLIHSLNSGNLDFVIFNEGNVKEKNVKLDLLTTLNYSFVYNDKFYKCNDVKDFGDLNNYPLILQKKSSNTRKFLDNYLNKKGIELIPQMEAVSQDLICGFVNCGIGIGFVLDEFKNKNYPNLKSINLKEQISTNIYIATNKSLKPTFAANKFIEELKKATNR